MDVTLVLPDEPAARLGTAGALPRRALEAFALAELDGFLKVHGVLEEVTPAELARDRQDLDRVLGAATRGDAG